VPNPKSLNKRLYEAIPLGGWLFFIEKKTFIFEGLFDFGGILVGFVFHEFS